MVSESMDGWDRHRPVIDSIVSPEAAAAASADCDRGTAVAVRQPSGTRAIRVLVCLTLMVAFAGTQGAGPVSVDLNRVAHWP